MSTRSNAQQCQQQRNRSLAGCATCRIRHVKCDETRPKCNICTQLNLDCQGYHSRLLFIKPGESQFQAYHDGSQFRRPLFTDSQRLSMSEELKRSLCSSSVGGALADLEEISQSLQTSQDDNAVMCEGPFSVFRSSLPNGNATTSALPSPESTTTSTSSHSRPDIDLEEVIRPDVPRASFEHNSHDDTLISPEPLMANRAFSSNELIEMVLGDFTTSTSNRSMEPHDIDTFFDSDDMFNNTIGSGFLTSEGGNSGEIVQQQELQQRASSSTFPPMSRIHPYPGNLAPEDAAFLLSHYKNHVIGVLSPLKYHRKTPWYILQLPCTMNILAELTMGIQSNAARGTLFYGILSISAFSLSNGEFCDTALWKQAGDTYQQQAHDYLRISLASETSGAKKAKYKEILMALLSMATMTAFKGTIEHARSYLLDAEKLIRLKGLTKPNKSRKIRLLHHCYAYLRIMFESTAITSNPSLLNRDNDERQEQATFQPSSAFRIGDRSGDIGRALEKDKDVELGQNDIHLEVPGRWLPTLYPAIYGIPEVFMCLLSQATRLANERAAALGGNRSLTTEEFSRYAKDVENQICQWAPSSSIYPEGHDSSVSPELVDSNRRVVNAMLHAMHQALIIFFYRRVYDISPFIIQHNVENTIKYLEASSLEDAINGGYTVAIVWPGFIAACEALNPDLQARFLSWFEVSQKGSGMSTFRQAKSIAEEVWRKREQNRGTNFSWVDVIREQNISILWT